jgi:beta-lactamase class A
LKGSSKKVPFAEFVLDHDTGMDPELQDRLEQWDETLRAKYAMSSNQTAIGVLDLKEPRLAMVRPDRMMYAASIPKIGILLAFFQKNPEAVKNLPATTRHELGLMIKRSSNEMATKFSRELGLAAIQRALNSYGFYEPGGCGGIWMGKHYGDNTERIGDPISDHSHAATVRQLLRFYLLLEQGKLVSSEAAARMREIFDSPQIPHDPIKFVKGLEGRNVSLRRKWGSWEDWLHDSAVIQGPARHYILVGLTNHARGDEYLVKLVESVDNWLP